MALSHLHNPACDPIAAQISRVDCTWSEFASGMSGRRMYSSALSHCNWES